MTKINDDDYLRFDNPSPSPYIKSDDDDAYSGEGLFGNISKCKLNC